MTHTASFGALSDRDLIAEIKRLAQDERHATAALVASLAEMDARRLYLAEGCASLFVYCTRVLHLSEHAAYNRIEAARLAHRFPMVLERLESGETTVTNLSLLRRHLTDDNCAEMLAAARHASKREVEQLIARIAPRPDAPVIVRKLPEPRVTHLEEVAAPAVQLVENAAAEVTSTIASPLRGTSIASTVKPLTAERYKVQLTVSRETRDKLRRAQDLLRHVVPNGDAAEIFDRALTLLVDQLERRKLAATNSPRSGRGVTDGSRRIPASVRRAVWARDGGRCAFVGREGRCAETGFLEWHHVVPFARGGRATVDNVQLRCRAHNQYEAVAEFGDRAVREGILAAIRGGLVPERVECRGVTRVRDRQCGRCNAGLSLGMARPPSTELSIPAAQLYLLIDRNGGIARPGE